MSANGQRTWTYGLRQDRAPVVTHPYSGPSSGVGKISRRFVTYFTYGIRRFF